MYFPRHWAKSQEGGVAAWGWSDSSQEDARNQAAARLKRVIACVKAGDHGPRSRYGYPDRPMREEILREFADSDGRARGVVSRNSYGCQVLNTSELMFVDVDAPKESVVGFLAGLFGRGKKNEPSKFETDVRAKVERWVAGHPGWGWRVYRTRAGARLVATHQPINSGDSSCHEAFEAFESDPLYRRLCATQKCYRARLTPKPWRCGLKQPVQRWPWESLKVEAAFREWERKYSEAVKGHATCHLIGQFGQSEIHPALRELLTFHDLTTRAESNLPLA